MTTARLSQSDFARLTEYIRRECGLHFPPEKRPMVEGRLCKRLQALELQSFAAYCEYLFSAAGQEKEPAHLFDTITTNTTNFFREPRHFDFLTEVALPELDQTRPRYRPLVAWSAACSSGEEPYTLAMVLSEYARHRHDFLFSVIGTDISHRVLEKAKLGIFDAEAVRPIPKALLHRYVLRGRDPAKLRYRVAPEIRALVEFRRMNLMDDELALEDMVDLLFCRNVLIYFQREVQLQLLSRLLRHLRPGGYLFLGHSESLNGMELKLEPAAPTVYRKT